MQFINNGPDVPDELLQAHEEGRVIFFCGAGISVPAGLPSFKSLVDKIYKNLGDTPTENEDAAYKRGQYDAMLDLLEHRIMGQRVTVRQALVKSLKPNLRLKGALDTHIALLQLAQCNDGSVRLVTTNFDRLFENAARKLGQPVNYYSAPMLPIPKKSRWNGLVYLHGRLPQKTGENELNRLVVTSGDFGLAYLTERWAARFVSELFRNHIVCFIGYSINDPVMRYMMDALAADRMLGESILPAYAFGDYGDGEEKVKEIEWKAKGVIPILYHVPTGSYDHSLLHQTLQAWMATYRDGILGKEHIVVNYALTRPSTSTKQDDFVGRMLWAISDESGLPAKRFANHNPAPPLEWLEEFSKQHYTHDDLYRFGIKPNTEKDENLSFSLIDRPTPYQLAPKMNLVSSVSLQSRWDKVMPYLGQWLTRYLNDPNLILWITKQGGHLHYELSRIIDYRLQQLSSLKKKGKFDELELISKNSPAAVPTLQMQVLWRLLLTGRIYSFAIYPDLYLWIQRLKNQSLTTTLRLELRELLSPKVALSKAFRRTEEPFKIEEDTKINHIVNIEIVLTSDHVRSTLSDLKNHHNWLNALPQLLEDFQQLLKDALDLQQELGMAEEFLDRSSWHLPSITPHPQNRGFQEWVVLIELLRDAWLALHKQNIKIARKIAISWFDIPYPTFKRLALFAASIEPTISSKKWVKWLLSNNAYWLWSPDIKREVLRLFVLQGIQLSSNTQIELEKAILSGPPQELYPKIEAKEWQLLVDRAVWLRLAKLKSSGLQLNKLALNHLEQLSLTYPDWQLATDERDEFSRWMSIGRAEFKEHRENSVIPNKRKELAKWLKEKNTIQDRFYKDDWREICRKRFFHCWLALCDLSKEGLWPNHWDIALQAWSEEGIINRSWHYAAPLVNSMPDFNLQQHAHAVAHWLEAASDSIKIHIDIFFDISNKVLLLPLETSTGILHNGIPIDEPITEAINHPIGKVTNALLNYWFNQEPDDNDKIPMHLKPIFTTLCNIEIDRYRHARVLLASRLIALFRVDSDWTKQYMLPLFNWSLNTVEARAMWEGFLWSPRLYRPLLILLKDSLLSTADHYNELGESKQQFAAFLTYMALDSVDGFSKSDFQLALSKLPSDGLEEVVRALLQAFEGAGEQKVDFWENRVQPFWQEIWPKSKDIATKQIAMSLAEICIVADNEFPKAVNLMLGWLQPIKHPYYIINLLNKSGLCSRFPETALFFLDAILLNQDPVYEELGQCLHSIISAEPSLTSDPKYRRLFNYARGKGLSL
ncbi:anti-phage defense-associated sirtuin Dsr1 [Acinetobacter lactucae]